MGFRYYRSTRYLIRGLGHKKVCQIRRLPGLQQQQQLDDIIAASTTCRMSTEEAGLLLVFVTQVANGITSPVLLNYL